MYKTYVHDSATRRRGLASLRFRLRGDELQSQIYIHTNTKTQKICQCNHGDYGVATVSSLDKLQVSFAEHSLFYRALLQKRPII